MYQREVVLCQVVEQGKLANAAKAATRHIGQGWLWCAVIHEAPWQNGKGMEAGAASR